jgi:hypothetical protein
MKLETCLPLRCLNDYPQCVSQNRGGAMLAKFKESAQGIAAIVALAAVFWSVKHHSLTELTASSGVPSGARVGAEFDRTYAVASGAAERIAGPQRASIPTDARDLPVCADLADALRLLQAARTQLLATASRIDADTASVARDQYRHAISHVRVELSKLHTLVAPDQYERLSRQVISATLPDDMPRLYSWELADPGERVSL